MPKLTSTQKVALNRLKENGGEGVRMKNGCVLARGVVLRYFDHSSEDDEPAEDYHDKLTWPVFQRLRDAGLAVIDGDRVKLVESAT